jgi:hypothetical protein
VEREIIRNDRFLRMAEERKLRTIGKVVRGKCEGKGK